MFWLLITFCFLFAALQLGGFDILNGDLEFITPGSYIIPTEDFDFLYNVSSSGVDVAFIDGPLSEQLFIKVSYCILELLYSNFIVMNVATGIFHHSWVIHVGMGIYNL